MAAQGIYRVNELFEEAICKFTNAPYCIVTDNMSNALWLCLVYHKIRGKEITIPSRTYVSVPCEIILAGGKVKFEQSETKTLKGHYQLKPYPIWDSALRFTADMYMPGQFQCVSFTGAFKHLKIGKAGAILTDNFEAYLWLKKARNSGRDEMSYHMDEFTMLGRNCYLHPSVAILGLQLFDQFYNLDGSKKNIPDTELPYPDLSQFDIYKKTLEEIL